MMSKFRCWWLYVRQHRLLALVIIIVLSAFILPVWIFGWDWTGLNGGYSQIMTTSINRGITIVTVRPPARTLWDFLQILIIPIMFAIVGFRLNQIQKERDRKADQLQKDKEEDAAKEREKADQLQKHREKDAAKKREKLERESREDNQHEAALQAYIDKMSELLLEKNLRESSPEDEVRKVAQVRTLTVLPRLDGKRKRNLLLFLYDAGLIDRGSQIINVRDADFSEADLSGVNLCQTRWIRDDLHKGWRATTIEADLSGINLWKADLSGADLSSVQFGASNELELAILSGGNSAKGKIIANLSKAKLVKANLHDAGLGGVDLHGADLSEAILSRAYLQGANLSLAILHGANLGIRPLIELYGSPEAPEETLDADPWITNLSEANLSGADLSEADLSEANLSGADLRGADLRRANLCGVILGSSRGRTHLSRANWERANLKGATGITTVELEKQAESLKGATMSDGLIHP